MFDISSNYIKFYPDLVGVKIPGTDRETKLAHAMLWGYFHGFEHCPDGCYSSIEKAAEMCRMTPKTAREARSDLIRLGWISVKRSKYNNKITNVFTRTSFVLHTDQAEDNRGVYFQRSKGFTSTEVTGLLLQKETATGVATPVPKESNIKKDITNSNNTSLDKQAKMCHSMSEDIPTSSSRKEVEDFPFDEEVENHSIRPDEKTKKNPSARAAIVAKRLYEIAGFGDLKPGNLAVSTVRKKMEAGAKEKDLIDLMTWTNTDEFYKGQGFMARLGDDAQQKFVLSKNKSKGVKYQW